MPEPEGGPHVQRREKPMIHPPFSQIHRLTAVSAALLCPFAGIATADTDAFTLGGSGSPLRIVLGAGAGAKTPKFTNNSGRTAAFASNVSWVTGGGATSTLNFDGNSDFIVAGELFTNALSSNIAKNGTGTLTLSANNSFSGGVIIDGGTVAVGHNNALGTGTLNLRNNTNARIRSTDATARTLANAVTISLDSTFGAVGTGNLTFTGAVNAGANPKTWTTTGITAWFSNAISGSSTQTITGSGTLWWSGNSSATLTGPVNFIASRGGTLRISHRFALGGTSGTTTITGGTGSTNLLEILGDISLSEDISIGGKDNFSATLRNVSGDNSLSGIISLLGGGLEYNIDSASGNLTIRSKLTTQNSAVRTLNISGAGNVSLDGIIANNGNGTIGEGTLTLSGNNTYTENTTVSAGTLVLSNTGGLRFNIGAAGVNNKLDGSGSATLDGTFILNLTSAGTTIGNSWAILAASLGKSYGGTFAVASTNGPFTNSSGIWMRSENGVTYRFVQSTGILSVIPSGANYASWAASFTNPALGDSDSTADPDHDGLTNAMEYALGLDPRYSSASPGAFDGTTLTFTKGALAKENPNVIYQIEMSDTLGTSSSPWTLGSAPLVTETPDAISITFPEGLRNFARLKVTIAP